MAALLALLAALSAVQAQPARPPAEFVAAIARCERPTVSLGGSAGFFVGCQTRYGDERAYAGLLAVDGELRLETGP